jgi:hypothetical protein
MLTSILKAFKNQQSGPVIFTRPDGVEVDLRIKRDTSSTCKWILQLFDGDEDAACEAVSSVTARALNKAGAPWPYLLKALENIAQERRAKRPKKDESPREIHDRFVDLLGISRMWLFGAIRVANDQMSVMVDGDPLLTDSVPDHARLQAWLLGDDPYVIHNLLSPQFRYKYTRSNGLQTLIDDVRSIRLAIDTLGDVSALRKDALALLKKQVKSCPLKNEFHHCLKAIQCFYQKVQHPTLLVFRRYGKRAYLPMSHNMVQEHLSDFVTTKRYTDSDAIRARWLKSALRLGVITRPLDWLTATIRTGIDPTEEWRDSQWYDDDHMVNVFGLRIISNLFPQVVTNG